VGLVTVAAVVVVPRWSLEWEAFVFIFLQMVEIMKIDLLRFGISGMPLSVAVRTLAAHCTEL
jgi:hypothetical protein